jgi:hypothetical protein
MEKIKKLIHSYTKWGKFSVRRIISLFLYGEREISEEEAATAQEQWRKEIPALEDLSSLPEKVLSSLSSLSEEEKWVFLFIWKTQNARSVWVSSGIWGSEWESPGRNKGYTYEEAWYTFKKEREELLQECVSKAKSLTPIVKLLIDFLECKIELKEINKLIEQRRKERIKKEKEDKERKEIEHQKRMREIEESARAEREELIQEAKKKGMSEELLQIFKLYLEKSEKVDVWELNKLLTNYTGESLVEKFITAGEEILKNKEKYLITERERNLLEEASKRLSPEVYKIFEGVVQTRITDQSYWDVIFPIITKYSGESTLVKFVAAEEELKKEIKNIKFKEVK